MCQPYKNKDFMHIYKFHTLNGTSKVNQAINNRNNRNIQSSKLTVVNLAQTNNSRSSERDPSLKLKALAWVISRVVGTSSSRSSYPISIKRPSLKQEAFAQATTRNRGEGEPLLTSLRRDAPCLGENSSFGQKTHSPRRV